MSINIFAGNLDGLPLENFGFENDISIKLVSDKKTESGNAFEYLMTKNVYIINFLKNTQENKDVSKCLNYNNG